MIRLYCSKYKPHPYMGVVCVVGHFGVLESMAVNAETGYYSSISGPDKKRYTVKVEDFAKIVLD